MATRRHELSDAAWARMAPLLPPVKPGPARTDDRLVVNAILWRLGTGAPWRDLPEQGAVKRPGPGRPRVRPDRVVADKGYTGRDHRAHCRRRGIRHTIARLRTEPPRRFDRAAYRLRNRVERTINRCKQFRALATRYDKLAAHYRALWLI